MFIAPDFNAQDTEPIPSEFLEQYEAKNIMKNKTCFKYPDWSILTNSPHSFQNTMAISAGLSDFHKMIITLLKLRLLNWRWEKRITGIIRVLVPILVGKT